MKSDKERIVYLGDNYFKIDGNAYIVRDFGIMSYRFVKIKEEHK